MNHSTKPGLNLESSVSQARCALASEHKRLHHIDNDDESLMRAHLPKLKGISQELQSHDNT
jgi:hypothetical protein